MWQMLRSLRADMMRQFGDVDRRFGDIDRRFEDIDRRFEVIDRRFDEISENFRDVRDRLDRLATDHLGLARELSELRGEMRGRLDERALPASG